MNATHGIISERLAEERLFNTIFVSILFLVGITGNVNVLLIFKFKIKTDRNNRYLIPFLAVVDIIACANGSVLSILKNTHRAVFPSEVLCKILYYVTAMTSVNSALLLMVISIVRHRVICLVNKHGISYRCQNILVFATSGASTILLVPMCFLYGIREYRLHNRNETTVIKSCTTYELTDELRIADALYFSFVCLILCKTFVVMTVLYSKIGHVIFKNASKRKFATATILKRTICQSDAAETTLEDVSDACSTEFTSSDVLNSLRRKRRKIKNRKRIKFTFMFLAMTVLFFVSYVPSVVFLSLPGNNPDDFWMNIPTVKLNVYLTLSRMYLFTHALNPVVYIYFDTALRRALIDSYRESYRKLFCL